MSESEIDFVGSYDNHDFLLGHLKDCDGTDILEFGVYSGQSLLSLLKQCEQEKIKYRKVFGFDSFCGLSPDETDLDIPEEWRPGSFDSRRLFNLKSPQDVGVHLEKSFREKNFDVRIIVGEYSKLNKSVVKTYDIGPAFYINIDCDLYSSAKAALNFIFDNDLLAINGLIRYDDYNSVKGGGEELAHNEIVEERGLIFEYLERCVFRYKGKKNVYRYRFSS